MAHNIFKLTEYLQKVLNGWNTFSFWKEQKLINKNLIKYYQYHSELSLKANRKGEKKPTTVIISGNISKEVIFIPNFPISC